MFKERLRAARITRGFTAQVLADYLNVGLRNYQKYESGDARPTYEGLVAIAEFLDVSIDFLLYRDDFLQKNGIKVDLPTYVPSRRKRKK